MARLKPGPWRRATTKKAPDMRFYDVSKRGGHSAWIKPVDIVSARMWPLAGEWRDCYGHKVEDVIWWRDAEWVGPQDTEFECLGHRESLELANNQDGSVTVTTDDGCEPPRKTTIPADRVQTVRDWLNQALEANQNGNN